MSRLAMAITLACCAAASADGGAPIARRDDADGVRVLLMRPAEACVGRAEVTLLGPPAPGWSLRVRGPSDGVAMMLPWSSATGAEAREATIDFDEPGAWEVAVGPPDGEPPLVARIVVGAAPPDWLARLPWALAWIPMVVVLALRQGAVSYTAAQKRA